MLAWLSVYETSSSTGVQSQGSPGGREAELVHECRGPAECKAASQNLGGGGSKQSYTEMRPLLSVCALVSELRREAFEGLLILSFEFVPKSLETILISG